MKIETHYQEMAKALAEPFPASEIDWRVGSTTKDKSKGMALAYLNGRCVQNRLDEVFGAFGWETRIERLPGGKGVLCHLTVTLPDGRMVTKCDGADETNFEATKGGISDSIKRAAVQFGIGRYLYYLDADWIQLKGTGNFAKFVQEPRLPAWALPGGRGRPPKNAPAPSSQAAPAHAPQQAAAPEETPFTPEHEPAKSDDSMALPGPPTYMGTTLLDKPFKGMPNKYAPDKYTWAGMLSGKPDGGRRAILKWLIDKNPESKVAECCKLALNYAAALEATGTSVLEEHTPF